MHLSDVTYPPIEGFGTFGTNPGSASTALNRFETVISIVVGSITVVGGIWFIFQIVTGAVQWISAGADKDGVQRAQKKFINAVIGLTVLVFSYALIGVVGAILGLDIFNFTSTVTNIVN